MLVDHDRQIAACLIQKTGETSWKVVMANNTNNENKIPLSQNPKSWIHSRVKSFGLHVEMYSEKLANYSKFMVVRHPLDRLLSAYYDKAFPHFMGKRRFISAMYGNISEYALSHFHSNDSITQQDVENYNATLEEFAHYTLGHPNNHWDDTLIKCGHCFIDYDYILRLETMDIYAVKVLSRHYPNVPSLPAYNSMRKTSAAQNIATSKTLTEFQKLNQSLIAQLTEKYKLSMDLFGYYYDDNSQSAYCSLKGEHGENCC